MSRETMEWLNQNTLIGFTDKRGHAWHHRASDQGAEPNHYPGAIPVEDVERRLFYWDAVERQNYVLTNPIEPRTVIDPDPATNPDGTRTIEVPGIEPPGYVPNYMAVPNSKVIMRGDNYHVMGQFKDGYTMHQYREWLIQNVTNILNHDTGLEIGSAGLLKGGAQAWVSVEVPDNKSVAGVTYRPNLLACTSFDGSLATTYKRTVTVTVCDNTMAAALAEKGQVFKVKHSKYSKLALANARDALAVMTEIEDDFKDTVLKLTSTKVTDSEWEQFLAAHVPIDEDSKRSVTVGTAKRDAFRSLYNHDERVAPWAGTAYGVLAAVNTYNHHLTQMRGDSIRAEANMMNVLTGKFATADAEALSLLAGVS